jgi:predicted dehydrogenase
VLAFPSIVPETAIGAGRGAPSDRVVMGAVGLGGMGTGNLGSFLGQRDCQMVAVCDVDKNHANRAKGKVDGRYKNKDCVVYGDFRELMAREDIDAVSMATPDHWHATVGIWAARTGKDMYGEKPFTHDLREGRAMVNAFKQHGRVWQTGSWQRSVAKFRQACELVLNGRVGKVHTCEVGLPNGGGGGSTQFTDPPPHLDYDMWVGPSPWAPYSKDRTHWNWRWQLDYGGGQMMDWIGHHADIAQWGLGTDRTGPVEFEPNGAQWPSEGLYDAPTSYKFTGTYANGIKIIVANAGQQPNGMGTRWIGDRGWIWVSRRGMKAEPASILKETIRPDEINLLKSPGHHRNFLDCVKSRRETLTPAEVAHRSASIGHVGMAALILGRKIKWDPDKEKAIGDPSADAILGRAKRPPWHQ